MPSPTRLGGEEGFEDLAQLVLGDADAVVDHPDHRIIARGHRRPVALQVLGQRHRLGLDPDVAALGHGVAGVDNQVDQHLLDLALVGADAPQPAPRHPAEDHQRQIDLVDHQPVQKMRQVAQHVL